jgi:hypothetical protein
MFCMNSYKQDCIDERLATEDSQILCKAVLQNKSLVHSAMYERIRTSLDDAPEESNEEQIALYDSHSLNANQYGSRKRTSRGEGRFLVTQPSDNRHARK